MCVYIYICIWMYIPPYSYELLPRASHQSGYSLRAGLFLSPGKRALFSYCFSKKPSWSPTLKI